MTELLQELERKLAKLPAEAQKRWVSHFLSELALAESNRPAKPEFEREWIGGRRPTPEEVAEAVAKIKELSKGNILGDALTTKDLINAGRRC